MSHRRIIIMADVAVGIPKLTHLQFFILRHMLGVGMPEWSEGVEIREWMRCNGWSGTDIAFYHLIHLMERKELVLGAYEISRRGDRGYTVCRYQATDLGRSEVEASIRWYESIMKKYRPT